MANRIRGITVEIGGDVTGLDKALSSVNKTIKDTQSQLKDVERLLKLDPSNTDLLAQKQKLLKDAITGTKEKLDALKDAQEQAKQQLERGDLGQDKYDALQREIIATEQELEKLAIEAGKSNAALIKLGETGQDIEALGGKITGVGEGLTKGVTAPIMAIGAASMAAFGEVDGAMDTLVMKTGASGKALEGMQTAVENLATTIPTDFKTAADAVGEVSTRFDDVGGNLEDLSGKFVKFATINNTDVVTAVDNVQASMAAFGVPTKNAGLVLDTLNGIAQQTGTDVNQLTAMMVTNAGVAKEMGMDYEDTASFLANLNKNGVDSSSVMTGLKKAWQTASVDGKSMDAVLKDMNTTIKNAKTDQEAYQAAIDTFGAKAGPAIAQAVRDGRLSLDDLSVSMAEYAGSVGSTFDATLDPVDQTTIMMNELKLVGADLASTAQEMLLPVMENVRGKLHELREWWSGLSEEQQQNIIKMAGIAAAVGPLLVGLGNVTSAVGKGMQAFSQFGTGLSKATNLMKTGQGPLAALKTGFGGLSAPILAVVAVIAVLAAAFVNLWKNNEDFRKKVTKIWEDIKKKFQDFAKGIQDRLSKLGISFEDIVNTMKKIWDGFCEVLAPIFEGAFQLVADILGFVLDQLTTLLDIFIGVFTGDWDRVWQGVAQYFKNIWDGISKVFSTVLDTLKKVFDVFAGWFNKNWDTLWSFAKIWVKTQWDAIKDNISNVVNGIKTIFSNGFNAAKNSITNIFNGIKNSISNIMNGIKNTVSNAIQAIRNKFNFTWSLPHLKLPHVSISGHFSLNPPSVPHFSIDWYKKAMENGMILNSPTIFGMKNGNLLAGGEAGSETVVGTKSLMEMIKNAVTNASGQTFGDVNVYVTGYGDDVDALAQKIGVAISRERRMAGSW